MSRIRRSALLGFVVIAGAVLLPPGAANATPGVNLNKCSNVIAAVPGPDEKLLVVASGEGCRGPAPEFESVVFRLNPDGTFDRTYGDDGSVFVEGVPQPDSPRQAYRMVDGIEDKLLIAYQTGLTRLSSDGSIDSTFGSGGHIDLGPGWKLNHRAVDIELGGGLILVADSNTPGEFSVRRYDVDGQPDPGFGTAGISELDLSGVTPGATYTDSIEQENGGPVAIMTQSRVPDTSPEDYTSNLIRLTAAGELDTTFGPTDQGVLNLSTFLPCPEASCFFFSTFPSQVQTISGGLTRVIGTKSYGFMEDERGVGLTDGFDVVVNKEGTGLTSDSFQNLAFNPLGSVFGGDLFGFPRRDSRINPAWDYKSRIYRTNRDGSGAFEDGKKVSVTRLAPVSYLPYQLTQYRGWHKFILVGLANGVTCVTSCEVAAHTLIAQFDDETGKPDPDFGNNGSVVIGQTCPNGRGSRKSISGWKNCRLPQVRTDATARLKKRATKKPSMNLRVVLSEFKGVPDGSNFRANVNLPAGITFTKNAAKRIVVTTRSRYAEGLFPKYVQFKTRAGGRNLEMSFRKGAPNSSWQGGENPNWKFDFQVEMKPGALKPIERSARSGRKLIRVTGAIDTANSAWYTGTSDRTIAVIRR